MTYSKEAAYFSTNGHLCVDEFVINDKGIEDVALFDFTSLFAAENAARIVERKGKRLLMCLVGDSLLEVKIYLISIWLTNICCVAILADWIWLCPRVSGCL